MNSPFIEVRIILPSQWFAGQTLMNWRCGDRKMMGLGWRDLSTVNGLVFREHLYRNLMELTPTRIPRVPEQIFTVNQFWDSESLGGVDDWVYFVSEGVRISLISHPLVNWQFAIESGYLQWVFPLKMVVYHSYVRLPEGILVVIRISSGMHVYGV